MNRVIEDSEIQYDFQQNAFTYIQAIKPIALAYKRGDSNWRHAVDQFFAELRSVLMTREDLTGVMNYFIYYLHKEIKSLNGSRDDKWEQECLPKLTAILDGMETLDEIEHYFNRILNDYSDYLEAKRERRGHYALLEQVRGYIEEHYGNPEMSLSYIGDKFNINPNYLSRLFKNEHGENFIDYVTNLRMDKAQRLLLETSRSVQDIASSIGYTTSIAFIRTFKKTFGFTPGDYRKRHHSS